MLSKLYSIVSVSNGVSAAANIRDAVNCKVEEVAENEGRSIQTCNIFPTCKPRFGHEI